MLAVCEVREATDLKSKISTFRAGSGISATQLVIPELTYATSPACLYAFPTVYPLGFAGLALGLARSAVDAFIELAATKTPRGGRGVLSSSAVIQSQIARAEANLRSARLFLYQTAADAWSTAGSEGLIPTNDRVLIRLASTHAIETAAQTVDTVYQAAGANAIFAGQPFERRFRDIHAVTQQVQGNPAHFESVGQFFLGLEPDMTWM